MNPIFVSDNINKLKSNTTKFCGHCKMEKDLIEFYKNKYEIDGLRAICKVCVKEYNDKNKEKAKEYYEKNKEKAKEYNEKNKEHRKEYYEKNKEKNKEKAKEYYQKNKEKNKEKAKEYNQKYYEKNKERGRIRSHLPQEFFRPILYRAKKRNLECMTKEEFIDWYNNQKRECHYCKRSEEEACKQTVNGRKFGRLSIDRKDNTRGYILNNIVLACFRCNGIKSAYYTEQEMLQFGAIVNKIEADRKTLEDEFNLKKENKIKTELQKLGVL